MHYRIYTDGDRFSFEQQDNLTPILTEEEAEDLGNIEIHQFNTIQEANCFQLGICACDRDDIVTLPHVFQDHAVCLTVWTKADIIESDNANDFINVIDHR